MSLSATGGGEKKGIEVVTTTMQQQAPDITMNNNQIPIWQKYTLTIEEAAQYFQIGENKLRRLIEENSDEEFILNNGNRKLIKRCLFEKFIDRCSAI